jgi:hypothetical protein
MIITHPLPMFFSLLLYFLCAKNNPPIYMSNDIKIIQFGLGMENVLENARW